MMRRTNKSSDEKLYRKAKSKVQAIRGFYLNAVVYCLVIPSSIYLNIVYTPAFQWWWMAVICWGAGLAIHAMDAFDWNPFLGAKWEERQMKKLLEKEKKRRQHNDETKQ